MTGWCPNLRRLPNAVHVGIRGYNTAMRYRLRSLVLLTVILPPLLAAIYWSFQWWRGHPPHPTLLVLLVVTHLAASIAGPVLWYHELMYMIGGPSPARLWRRR